MIQHIIPKFLDILYDEEIKSLVSLDEVRDAFHTNQILSKNKAIAAYDSIHRDGIKILYIGSWFGVLTNYILENYNTFVAELDMDMRCNKLSSRLNFRHSRYLGNFVADINVFDRMHEYDAIINLSTEHMSADWFARVKPGTLLVMQSNNLKVDDHINTCIDLDDMKNKYPLTSVSYSNTLELNVFNRFTLAGTK